MKLYVWEACFTDYTDGLAVVLAPDLETARAKLREAVGYDHHDIAKQPTEHPLDSAVAFWVHGGG